MAVKTINVPEDLHAEIRRLAQLEADRLHLPGLSVASFIAQLVALYKEGSSNG